MQSKTSHEELDEQMDLEDNEYKVVGPENATSLSKWVLNSIVKLSEEVDRLMVFAVMHLSTKTTKKHVQFNADLCAQFFRSDLVRILNMNNKMKKCVVEYVEKLDVKQCEHLTDMVARERWSPNVKKCICDHGSAAGWVPMDQPSYFKEGCRFYDTRCLGCSKTFVAHAAQCENQCRVGTSASDRVYVCASEATEDCRCIICQPCWQGRFSDESRSRRTRKAVVYIC